MPGNCIPTSPNTWALHRSCSLHNVQSAARMHTLKVNNQSYLIQHTDLILQRLRCCLTAHPRRSNVSSVVAVMHDPVLQLIRHLARHTTLPTSPNTTTIDADVCWVLRDRPETDKEGVFFTAHFLGAADSSGPLVLQQLAAMAGAGSARSCAPHKLSQYLLLFLLLLDTGTTK